ncbi:MAG: tetratricopeptide repeat protein, partial [Kofleriaceae bacterium]
AELLAAAARCRANVELPADEKMSLAARLEQADVAGDLEGALDLAQQLWRLDLGHPGAFRVLASSYRLSGDLPGLTELTTLRASKTQVGEERAAAWLEVARLAEDLGKFDEAARAYDLALIEEPGHTSALDARGALAFKLGDWPTADLIYRDLGPGESMLGDEELALRRSIIAERLGRDTEALELARAAAGAAPGRRDILMRIQELATRLGETALALVAARAVLDLVPLDDDEALMATQFALVDLYRTLGDLPSAIQQLERIVRDHPHHAHAIEQLAEVHVAKGDWDTATRYFYQLVPLAPSPGERADRLYQLGEAVLVHLGDVDRADDVFLRASDLDPTHVPTLRRLLDVYWRADDPAALVEVTGQLASSGSLSPGPISRTSLAQALVAAAVVGDTNLVTRLVQTLGESASGKITDALVELSRRPRGGRRLGVQRAVAAIVELGKRGVLDLTKLRAAAAGTVIAPELE